MRIHNTSTMDRIPNGGKFAAGVVYATHESRFMAKQDVGPKKNIIVHHLVMQYGNVPTF